MIDNLSGEQFTGTATGSSGDVDHSYLPNSAGEMNVPSKGGIYGIKPGQRGYVADQLLGGIHRGQRLASIARGGSGSVQTKLNYASEIYKSSVPSSSMTSGA